MGAQPRSGRSHGEPSDGGHTGSAARGFALLPVEPAIPARVAEPIPKGLRFAIVKDVPSFDIVTPPPAPMPVVYTDRTPEVQPTLFVVSTTATLAPRFSLID